MKTIKTLLLALMILPLPSLACLDSNVHDVDNYLAQRLGEKGYGPEVIPELLILKNKMTFSATAKGLRKDIFLEFFIKSNPGSYRLVPGLGLSLKASENSLFYVCVNMKGLEKTNYIRLVHLERQGIVSKRFNTDPVALYVTPVNEGELLLGGFLQTFGISSEKKLNALKASQAVQNALNKMFQGFFKLGVEQIEIRPKEVEITTVSKILNRFESSRTKHSLKMDSPWLTSY